MKKYKIYLDNCCFNRPYDDQTQIRIEIETRAKLYVQQMIVDEKILLVSSIILEYENNDNPYFIRKTAIRDFVKYASLRIDGNDEVVKIAEEIKQTGIKAKDAAHLACAIYAGCDYFLTTDDRLLKFKDDRITVMNPIDFISVEVGNDE